MSRVPPPSWAVLRAVLLTAALAGPAACEAARDPGPAGPAAERTARGWSHYGGDAGGQRFAAAAQLTPDKVAGLEVAWSFHTGDVSDGTGEVPSTTAFEATPILVEGRLVFCSPMNRIFALDPATGAEHWSYDPQIDLAGRYANQLVCRGVASWRDPGARPEDACATRVLTATNDARLLALDTRTGRPCDGFGSGGEVDLAPGAGPQRWQGEYQVTSPPVLAGDVVVVGSAVSDNQRLDAPSGVVRGFDARSGALRWAFDLAPPGAVRTPGNTSRDGYLLGTPNVWAPMAVDPARGLVFVPTGNPAPDYWRGSLPGMDHYGSSVLALRAGTGEVVWRFQTVHHDLWDYDVPAQPTLTTVTVDGETLPVVVQATKMGLVFVLHRETGEPVHPVEERPVPGDGAPGETLSPTQPFPVRPPPLARHRYGPEDAWGLLGFDRWSCRRRIEALRHDGIYTPPTLEGTLMVPGNAGGTNWGGVAVHPERHLLVARASDLPFTVRLLPRDRVEAERAASPRSEISPQEGTPYGMRRDPFLSFLGLPCVKPPWGRLFGIDLDAGEIVWERRLGTTRDLAPLPIPWESGTPGIGGPLVTAGGLVFIGAALDDYLRAFDLESGRELWKGRLPAGGQATPMSYVADGRQFVVIAAGGHARAGSRLGDALVAFALPEGG